VLETWLLRREALCGAGTGPLFVSFDKSSKQYYRMTQQAVSACVTRASEAYDGRRRTSHALRTGQVTANIHVHGQTLAQAAANARMVTSSTSLQRYARPSSHLAVGAAPTGGYAGDRNK
jgi:hypothetical protein